ncbi:MAG: sulfotransferase, partial [Pseudomonadota bacterium]
EFQAQKEFFSKEFVHDLPGGGASSTAPIFIVGLPRAGSTLLEQILASHPDVEGTLELPNILALAHKLNGRRQLGEDPRYPAVLKGITPQQRTAMGDAFLADTAVHRGSAPRFTDKMPNNFRHIGLIRMILPEAKIIDARRDPIDCCFSGFKQLFAEGQEFSYSLDDLGRYYRGYVDLMDHWNHVFPGNIIRMQYEDVVKDLEGSVRRLLSFCHLTFEEQCLRFFETDRSVRTASSEQVRQPIYSSGIGQWRPFEAYLEPLFAALGPLAPERSHA